MPFIGNKPSAVPLTSADIADSIITSAKITDATIVNGDIANSTIALAKLSATGTPSAATFLRGDNAWGEAGAAAGYIIQVVTATDSTTRSTTGTSFVTASNTLSVSITPSSASNKILVMVDGGGRASNDDASLTTTIYRGATNLGDSTGGLGSAVAGSEAGGGDNGMFSMHLLDSPATTSSTTYQVYIKNSAGAGTVYINNNRNNQTSKSSITVMEVKG
jgi:hypothetical protein